MWVLFRSRTDGSVSGSNSSLELYSVPRPPDVRRQKVVPTQKTCVISPPRPRDAEKALSPPQSRVVSYSGPDHSAASDDDVVCIDDDAEDDSDVICISEEAGRVSSPVGERALFSTPNRPLFNAVFPHCCWGFYPSSCQCSEILKAASADESLR